MRLLSLCTAFLLAGCYLFQKPRLAEGMPKDEREIAIRLYKAREAYNEKPGDVTLLRAYQEARIQTRTVNLNRWCDQDNGFDWKAIDAELIDAVDRALPGVDGDTAAALLLARARSRPKSPESLVDALSSFEKKPDLQVALMLLGTVADNEIDFGDVSAYREKSFELCKQAYPLAANAQEIDVLMSVCQRARPVGSDPDQALAFASAADRKRRADAEPQWVKFQIVNKCALTVEVRTGTLARDTRGDYLAHRGKLPFGAVEGVVMVFDPIAGGEVIQVQIERGLKKMTIQPNCTSVLVE